MLVALDGALSSSQSFTQCKVPLPESCSSSEMRQQRPQGVVCMVPSTGGPRSRVPSRPLPSEDNKKRVMEQLWQELFSDPSEWRDHRLGKVNPRFPDFKHQKTQEALWVQSKWTPPWVEVKLSTLAPGIIKSSSVALNQRLARSAKAGQPKKTLELYKQMQRDGIDADRYTFCPVLSACASLGDLEEGRRIHKALESEGLESDLFVASSLIDMYGKCGSIEDAERVFNQMHERDVVVWTAMIMGYVKCGEAQLALGLYQQMQWEHVDPNPFTFVAALNACACEAALEAGRALHESIMQRGYDADVFVQSSLVDMYSKCGSIEDAERAFKQRSTRDVVVWNAMIMGYVKCGEAQHALKLYQQMLQEHVDPNPITFVAVLSACGCVAALEEGRVVHEVIIHRGYEANVFVQSCLVEMYSKCGSIEEAERAFKGRPTRDVVVWNAMIMGYVKCGEAQQALGLYRQMQQEHMDPNPFTFVAVLNACACEEALEEGRVVHEAISQMGYEADVFVQSSLVDMYGKCGSIEEAERVFKQSPTKDVVVWAAMLAAFGRHGYVKEALEHFKQMSMVLEVNDVTFTSLLTACRHGGLVDDGLEYFKSISTVYKISPTVEHYACVVDLLGRAGRLREAEDLIMSMPMDPDATLWMSLLGACRVHVNVEMGERCAKRLLELEPDDAAGYVLLSEVYVAAGKLESGVRIHQERLDRGLKETPGRSWIEVKNQLHSFVAGDSQHPQRTDILAELQRLSCQMEDAGFAADTRSVLHCINDEKKEGHHSENLAVAFGLINTTPGTTIRVFKNRRMCGNCHMATKFITKIAGRAIVVRDVNLVHRFKDGLCSCRDYW